MMDELRKKSSGKYKLGKFLGRTLGVIIFFSILYFILSKTTELLINYKYTHYIGVVIIAYFVILIIAKVVKK